MKISLFMRIILAFGFLCWTAGLGAAAGYVTSAPLDPSRRGAWFVLVFFGGVTLLMIPRFLGFFRHHHRLAAISDDGVTNLGDGLGPIAWHDIRGASIKSLGHVRYVGERRVLYVEVPDAIAKQHLARASWVVRWGTRPRSRDGCTTLEVMGYPPYAEAELQAALATILARSPSVAPQRHGP